MTSLREIAEGTQEQGVAEIIVYTLDCTRYGVADDPVTNPDVTVWLIDEDDVPEDPLDVTDDVMPTNSPTVDGQIITLSPLQDLEADKLYCVKVQFDKTGFTPASVYALIRCRL